MTPPSLSATATDTLRPAGTPAWLRRLGEATLDLLLPPRCVACEQPVLRQGLICAACFGQMTFITAPACARCGIPFDSDGMAGPDQVCAHCRATPPSFRATRAALLYNDGARRLLLPFKHGDQPTLAAALAPHMARAGTDLLRGQPVLVPVPLHRTRLFHRRYNQAALLAWAIGRIAHCPVVPDALRRVRATPSLDHRGAEERRAMVADAFALRPARQARIAGQAVVLVDDVMTSGATAEACAATLLQGGAASVDVLVAARVPLADAALHADGPARAVSPDPVPANAPALEAAR